MSRSVLARALALGFALTLAAPSAWAGPRRHQEESGSASLVTQLWRSIIASWSEVGCWIDPNGACGTGQAPAPPPDTEIGCWIDPYGGCGTDQIQEPPPQIDEGCWLDPNGGCRAGS